MMWFFLSLATAFFESLRDVFGKRVSSATDPTFAAWSERLLSVILLIPIAYLLDGPPVLQSGIWFPMSICLAIGTYTMVLYMEALRESPLTLSTPLLKLSPLFITITSPIITHEYPTWLGTAGVLLSVVGTYWLHISEVQHGILEPFRALLRESGTRKMLLIAALWAISAPFDKVGILHSSPIWWLVYVNFGLFLTILLRSRRRGTTLRLSIRRLPRSIPGGTALAIALSCQMIALTLAPVAYVIGLKRCSVLFNMFWGKFVFGEEAIGERMIGSLLLLAGMMMMLLEMNTR